MFTMDVLAQLRKAMEDPTKRKIIARDAAIVGGLVLVLSNPDKTVVIEALDIIFLLALPVENRTTLRECLGMLPQLTVLADHTNPIDHVRNLAQDLLNRLHSDQAVEPVAPCLKARNKNIQSTPNTCSRQRKLAKPTMVSSKFKTITLQIQGLDDKNDMEVCRERLLTIRGIVSITFDLSKHRSIVRTKAEVSPQTLANAIQSCNTMIAGQVVRTETGEEQVISLQTDTEKENASLPAYLPDEDSPMKVDDKAVRRFGAKEEQANGGGWLGAAASFLANSFYW